MSGQSLLSPQMVNQVTPRNLVIAVLLVLVALFLYYAYYVCQTFTKVTVKPLTVGNVANPNAFGVTFSTAPTTDPTDGMALISVDKKATTWARVAGYDATSKTAVLVLTAPHATAAATDPNSGVVYLYPGGVMWPYEYLLSYVYSK